MVGQGQCFVALLQRGRHQLVWKRSPVEERKGRVAMELDVHFEHMFASAADGAMLGADGAMLGADGAMLGADGAMLGIA